MHGGSRFVNGGFCQPAGVFHKHSTFLSSQGGFFSLFSILESLYPIACSVCSNTTMAQCQFDSPCWFSLIDLGVKEASACLRFASRC